VDEKNFLQALRKLADFPVSLDALPSVTFVAKYDLALGFVAVGLILL
jgi:hypothetical protein